MTTEVCMFSFLISSRVENTFHFRHFEISYHQIKTFLYKFIISYKTIFGFLNVIAFFS